MNIVDFFQAGFRLNLSKQIFSNTIGIAAITVLLSTNVLTAQQEDIAVYEITQLQSIDKMRGVNTGSALPSYIKPEVINPLIRDLVPSVYMVDGSVSFYGDKPVRVHLDHNALRSSIARQPKFDNIEIAEIRISNISEIQSLNLDNLAGFVKLKYVYIVCSSNCDLSQMRNTVTNLVSSSRSEKDYVIIYNVENQS